MPISRNTLQRITPYIPGKTIQGLTKMASNENALGSAVSWEQLKEAFEKIHVYPDISSSNLIEKLSKKLGVSTDQIILGNGSDEIIQMLALAYLNPGDEVFTLKHTFSEYEFAAHLMDARCVRDRMSEKTKLVFIANPNNPTGTIMTRAQLDAFLKTVPAGALVIMDEAYYEYVESSDYPDIIRDYPDLMVLRTFSKLYGLAGFRIGYGVAKPEVISTLRKVCQPFNINSLALKAAELALDATDHVRKTLEMNRAGKKYLYVELNKLGLPYLETEANFICIQLQSPVYDGLLKQGIIVRPLESFGLPNHIRVTIGTEEQNRRFIDALKKEL